MPIANAATLARSQRPAMVGTSGVGVSVERCGRRLMIGRWTVSLRAC